MGETPELFEKAYITACVSVNRKHLQDSENCPFAQQAVDNRRLTISFLVRSNQYNKVGLWMKRGLRQMKGSGS